ncbi:unnamed protein product [Adineta ricciae]|uniref:SANT domain-containing protein n=1 Tax=Adineta ricciae TaxID=249248 RepID=A0A814KX85_ADIRI|nr:unnamed protein product [Adineta ricciae]CAF1197683.1 unnamed protein product [Adineta ricciae]
MAFRRPRVNVKPNVPAVRPASSIARPQDTSAAPAPAPTQEEQIVEQVETASTSPTIQESLSDVVEETNETPALPTPTSLPPPPDPVPIERLAVPISVPIAPSSPPPPAPPASTPASRLIFRKKIAPNIGVKSVIHNRRASASCSGTESESESVRQKHSTASSITYTRIVPSTSKTIVESEPQLNPTSDTSVNEDVSNSTKLEAMITDSPEIQPPVIDNSQYQVPSLPTRMNTRISREYISQHITYRAQRLAGKVEPEMTIRKRRAATLEKLDETGTNKGTPVDTSKLKIADFVHYNPVDNPMEVKQKSTVDTSTNPVRKHSFSSTDGQNSSLAPQLKIDANGVLVVDEESLYIRNMDDTPRNTVIVEGQFNDDNLTHQSYRKIGRRKRWSTRDTLRFYQALRMCGTDFTLIARVFPNRDRDDIKRKFKTEDKANRTLIDSALNQRVPFDLTCFFSPSEESSDDENGDMNDNRTKKGRKGRLIKRKSKQTSSSDPLEINRRRERRLQSKKNSTRVKKSAEFVDDEDEDENEDESSMDVADTVEVSTTQPISKMEHTIPPTQTEEDATDNSLTNMAELENLLGRIDGGHLLFVHNTDETTGLDRIDVHVVMPNTIENNPSEQSI